MALVAALGGCTTSQLPKPVSRPPVAAVAPPPTPVPLPPPPVQSIPTPPPDPVVTLIQQAETIYASGMEEYRAGNFDKAKEKFDQAVSLLLESKMDLTADERLNKEFEKLVENIHGLEVASLESETTPTGHKEEPTAIESFSGLTFPVDPHVKERAQKEIKVVHSELPLISNDYVDGVLTYFQGRGRGFIERVLRRLGAYQPIFTEVLNKEGLPPELVYLAAGESAFNPLARSRKGAKGIWQFMPGTGALYGLRRNSWVDEREDPAKSTEAAARHLKDLYNTFGDWYLAMAAYDSGPMTVQRAIERTGYADYWTLRSLHALPRETENYVPIFLATALIGKDPKAYGFDVEPDPPLTVDQVAIGEPTDLRLIAELIDHPVDELIKLNPSLLRWTTPANDPEFKLNLPPGTGDVFEKAIASIPSDKRIWWRSHKVDGGETVASIAQKYRISTVALARANGIERDTELDEGTRLVLPLAPGRESSLQRVHESVRRHAVWYRIRRGDTLEMLADRFDVTSYQIRRWNHLKSQQLVPGRTLLVYEGGTGSASHRARPRKKTARRSTAKNKPSKSKASRAANHPKPSKKHAAQPVRAGR
ncbi:MAG TPA: transglycosylase SLT domain-containing protein [Terriglobia bacterium]|nr:transglycosylase SLT domain-containing protein [Terriglobia bacterium]